MKYYFLLGIILLLCIGKTTQAKSDGENKPNIILIIADDLGWKDVSYNGGQYYETPNIDRLSQQGITFTDAYANAPVCGPSRAALMKGQYATRTGFYTYGSSERGRSVLRKVISALNMSLINKENFTVTEYLKTADYKTGFIGKWQISQSKETRAKEQGFDINVAGYATGKPQSLVRIIRYSKMGPRENM